MNKCDICGEIIDWNNPNINYGGHTCSEWRLNQVNATERYVASEKRPYVSISNLNNSTNKFEQKMKLSWKDVFDGCKLYPSDYQTCLKFLKPTNYRFIAFDGQVYKVDDVNMQYPICMEDDL